MHHLGVLLATLVALSGPAIAQFDGWLEGQIGTEICFWSQPRAAILRDKIYLDGGNIWWLRHMEDGTLGEQVNDNNVGGFILNYNLSTPFDSETNLTGILLQDALTKARGGEGNSIGMPTYIDGGMLANDAEFFLYGGTYLRNIKNYEDPDADWVLEYQGYQYGPDKPAWKKGFKEQSLDDGVTRYLAYGAAVNAPSENKAWYFSGLESPTRGEIYTNDPKNKAVNVSNTLIQLDMSEQLSEKWTNKTLPDFIEGRSNAEVVWVPVGEQGILVVLGGVVYPEWSGNASHKSPDVEASEEISPGFMSTIDIYDIANDEWYQQSTEDGPGTRARGCAVVATASDNSSFNIFYYGGFDGIHFGDPFSDEVWALSLPSFTWTKINDGEPIHGRSGHKCFLPYPDQMMILGGYTSLAGTPIPCLDKGPVVLFNVTSGEWLDKYDPTEFSDYGVHEKIRSQIGGDASGGATVTAPVPSGWATSALADVFATPYDMAKITTWYPYEPAASTDRPNLDNPDDGNDNGGSGLPKWVAPVLGVVLGLMFVTGCIVLFCLWRRRKIFKSRSSEAGTEDTGMRIISWMRGQQMDKGTPTITTSEGTTKGPEMEEAKAIGGSTPSGTETRSVAPAEMDDTQLVELADTSPPVELHDTGLSPIEIIQKHSHLGQPKSRSVTDPSYSSFSAGIDRDSTVSQTTDANSQAPPPPASPPGAATPTSPSPASPAPSNNRVVSNISGVSERDAAHLRQMSEGTLSLTSVREEPRSPMSLNMPGTPGTEQLVVSPPTADEEDTLGQDYISVKAASPSRKSIFKEEEDDDDDSKRSR